MDLGLGGHNAYEAIRGGSSVIFGPDMANFQEVADDLLGMDAAMEVRDAHELGQHLQRLMSEPSMRIGMQDRSNEFASQDKRKREFVIDSLEKLLSRSKI